MATSLIVLAILPRAGLGNKLFVWARAATFARLNNFPLHVLGWSYPALGPVLRRERRDIFYHKQFAARRYRIWSLVVPALRGIQVDPTPPIDSRERRKDETENSGSTRAGLFVFRAAPHWTDYFAGLRENRGLIIQEFRRTISSKLLDRVLQYDRPAIAIHVRRGDFRELAPHESFADVGLVRTPLNYFMALVRNARSCGGQLLAVSVFSDGSDEELRPLLAIDNVFRAPELPDAGHLLLMSMAKVIVMSAHSTFSQWAGFLSQAALIHHPDHIHAPIRSPSEADLFEGTAVGHWTTWKPGLISALQHLSEPE